jgi:transposase
MRAHCLLLSNKKYTIEEITNIHGLHRDTVSSLIDSWHKFGLEGLYDQPRSGRPSKLTEDEKDIAIDLLREDPKSIKKVIEILIVKTGKKISADTLKRTARNAGLSWKRVRKSLKSKQDKKEFEKTKKEIENLEEEQKKGEINLYYFDESGFDLTPSIPYAWQPIGTNLEIPSSRSPRINVLGFLDTVNNDFESFIFNGSVNSEVVVACFDKFSESLSKKTVVIIDNASTHTSKCFTEKIVEWEGKGLVIKRLPAYSPELNLIEILWRFIKYHWLPFSAYLSHENLTKELEKILSTVGSKYQINFN